MRHAQIGSARNAKLTDQRHSDNNWNWSCARDLKRRFPNNKCGVVAYEAEQDRSGTGGHRPGEGLEQARTGARDETDDY